jgi:hypothetical protein
MDTTHFCMKLSAGAADGGGGTGGGALHVQARRGVSEQVSGACIVTEQMRLLITITTVKAFTWRIACHGLPRLANVNMRHACHDMLPNESLVANAAPRGGPSRSVGMACELSPAQS